MTATPNHRPALRLFRLACAAAAALLLAGCGAMRGEAVDDAPEETRPALATLMGDWHVAARVPWFGERGRVAHRIRFTADGDNRVDVQHRWRRGFAEPEESDDTTARYSGRDGRLWTVRMYGVLPSKLRILEVAADGRWLLLDAPGRGFAWILTRDQVVEDGAYLELEERLERHGVNTDKLRRVAQVPAEDGKLGFEQAAVPMPRR
jgi:apolipoprotein D and lipocalin family protein